MTIEHAPSTNGRVSSGELYDEPKAYRQKRLRRPRIRRPRIRGRTAFAGLLTPLLVAIAALVVVRSLTSDE